MSEKALITFRSAQRADLPAIVQLLADDPLGKKREDFRDPLPEAYLQAFNRINQDENQQLMVVIGDQQQIIGTLQLTFLPYLTYRGGVRAQIEAVRIHKDYRGRGLGEQVFRWAIETARAGGAHLIQLTTDKQRPDAVRFYEKLGFRASHVGMKLHF